MKDLNEKTLNLEKFMTRLIRNNYRKAVVTFIICFLSIQSLLALERRKEQFPDQLGYMAVPAPYSLPGIGEGWVLFGSINNGILDYGDAYGYGIMGDAEGYGFGVSEIHLIPKMLYIEYSNERISKASKMIFHKRGMDSEKEDFRFYEVDYVDSTDYALRLSLFDRMLELSAEFYQSGYRVTKIRDDDGELITEVEDPSIEKSKKIELELMVDWTDDFLDPRQGINFKVIRASSPRDSNDDPNYHVMNYNIKAYIPIGSINTLVFNYFQSNAHVTSEGDTDRSSITDDLGYNCSSIPDSTAKAICEVAESEAVDQIYAHNKYGDAQSLGGRRQLRSYPDDRFVGANTLFYGVEFRWNLTEEYTPFNLIFIDDVRTGVQLAMFHETGGVADLKEDVTKDMRSSSGVGMRIVTGSGIVYRIDYATGDEGGETTMIINYPW
jgi:hypothetical protein